MNFTLKHLYAFRAVAEAGSFTRAAERLGTAQPVLSTQIRDLETDLRVKLFDRTTRRVELTQAGRHFLARIEGLVAGLEQAVGEILDLADRRQGRLTIAAPPLLAATILPPVLRAFRDQHPGIEFTLIDKPTVAVLEAVHSKRADVGVGTFPVHATNIAKILLARDELMLYRRCADAAGDDVRWSDLAREKLIALTPGSGIRSLVDSGLRAGGVDHKPLMEVDQVATALALAAAGFGSTVLPSYVSHAKLSAYRLREPEIARELSIATARDVAPSPAAQAFIAFLRRSFRLSSGPLPPPPRADTGG